MMWLVRSACVTAAVQMSLNIQRLERRNARDYALLLIIEIYYSGHETHIRVNFYQPALKHIELFVKLDFKKSLKSVVRTCAAPSSASSC